MLRVDLLLDAAENSVAPSAFIQEALAVLRSIPDDASGIGRELHARAALFAGDDPRALSLTHTATTWTAVLIRARSAARSGNPQLAHESYRRLFSEFDRPTQVHTQALLLLEASTFVLQLDPPPFRDAEAWLNAASLLPYNDASRTIWALRAWQQVLEGQPLQRGVPVGVTLPTHAFRFFPNALPVTRAIVEQRGWSAVAGLPDLPPAWRNAAKNLAKTFP